MEKIMQLKTIKEYNDYMGVETRHPLVSVIEGSRMPHPVPHARKHVGMYVVFLKELRCTDDLTYGRRSYDFQENTLVFIAPGQVFGHEADGTTFTGSGWCLLFRSAAICRIILFSPMPPMKRCTSPSRSSRPSSTV